MLVEIFVNEIWVKMNMNIRYDLGIFGLQWIDDQLYYNELPNAVLFTLFPELHSDHNDSGNPYYYVYFPLTRLPSFIEIGDTLSNC